jgi:tetratricopeptide (TPR) repeat protein
MRHSFCFLLAILISPMLNATSLRAQESREEQLKYFNGLRERRLFSLAETVCLQRLQEPSLDSATRSNYTVELSRTLAEHARFVANEKEQSDLLNRARQIIVDLLRAQPNHPRKLLLRSQLLIVGASQVETYRWRFELTPNDNRLANQAMTLGQDLIPDLERLEKDMGDELRAPFRDPLGEKLKPYQLRGLQRAVRYQLANLLLNLAKTLDRSSPDRAEALLKANDWFRKLSNGEPGATITWRSQIGLVQVTRLKNDMTGVARMLNALSKDSPPASIRDEIAAESVQVMIDDGDFTQAADALRVYRLEHKRLSGRLWFLNAQVLLKMQQVAIEHKQEKLADDLMKQVIVFVSRAQTESDSFWAARAQQLIAGASSSQKYGAKIAAILRQGKEKFAAGDTKPAAELYEQAFSMARMEGNVEVAVELGYTLGSMLLQMKTYDAAAQIFGDVVKLNPKHKLAPDADLLQIFALGNLYAKHPTRIRREAYTVALESHRKQFVTSATAGEATWMLAQLEERRLQFTKSLNLYLEIPAAHKRSASANAGAARCAEAVLVRLTTLKKPIGEWETVVSDRLMQLCGPVLKKTKALSQDESELLVITSKILSTKTIPNYKSADELLAKILTSPQPEVDPITNRESYPGVTEEQQQTAIQLRIVTFASRGQINEARSLLNQLAEAGIEKVFEVLASLDVAAARLDSASHRALGQLQLDMVRTAGVKLDTLPAPTQEKFLRAMGSAHEMALQQLDAATYYEELLVKKPKDLALIEKIARLRMTSQADRDWELAKQHWLKLETSAKRGSVEWLQFRFESLVCMDRLKDRDMCLKKLKLTTLLYPKLGNPTLKKRYDDLAQRVAR